MPGVIVEVVDDDAADVTIVQVTPDPAGANGGIADDGALIGEDPSGDLPAFDPYAVLLSKRPTGNVTIAVSVDGEAWVRRAGSSRRPRASC